MASNYPPGVTGNEPQIAGDDEAFEAAFVAWMAEVHPEHDQEADWDGAIDQYNDAFLEVLAEREARAEAEIDEAQAAMAREAALEHHHYTRLNTDRVR